MNAMFTGAELLHSMVIFLILGSVAGLLFAVILLSRPDWIVSINAKANGWVSTRKMVRPLERAVDSDRWLYRYSRVTGVLLLSGSLYIHYIFTANFDRVGVLNSLFKNYAFKFSTMGGILDAMVLFFLIGAQLAMVVSFFLLFRPSMLRDLEEKANQRLSMRKTLKPLEMQMDGIDQYVFKNMQLVGILILLGSGYTLVALARWLMN